MPNWTLVPAGRLKGATDRFWTGVGDEAEAVAERMNTDPAYLGRVTQFAVDGKAQHVAPVGDDLARLIPTPAHMLADLRGMFRGNPSLTDRFAELSSSIPCLPAGNFPVVLPVVYTSSLEATVQFYWKVCQARYPAFWQWPELKLDAKNLRPWSPDGKARVWPKGELRFVSLDLLAYYDHQNGTTVEENRAKENAPMPGVEILALMALAPAFGQAMDGGVANGGRMPWLDLPGLEANISGKSAWSCAPIVNFARDGRGLWLDARHVSRRNRHCASPAFRECRG